MEGRLSRRQCTKRIAEGTGCRSSSRGAVVGSREDKLRAEGPLIYISIAQHAHDAAVIENASASADAGFAVAQNIPCETDTRSHLAPHRPKGVRWHPRIARNAILTGEEYSRRRVGVDLGGCARSHRRQV